jgi:hypothetical protein
MEKAITLTASFAPQNWPSGRPLSVLYKNLETDSFTG